MHLNGWIWEDNLRTAFEAFSIVVGYGFDDSDWLAIEHGVTNSDAESDVWCDYTIPIDLTRTPSGAEHAHMRCDVARDVGSSVFLVRITAEADSPELQSKLDTVMMMCSEFHLRRGGTVG
jgi:hypothetical protein